VARAAGEQVLFSLPDKCRFLDIDGTAIALLRRAMLVGRLRERRVIDG